MARQAKPRVVIVGADEVRASLRRMGDDLADLRELHADIGEIVADRARELVPIGETSRLHDSIRTGRQAKGAIIRAGRSRTVPYAGPIHFGWPAHGIEPDPFLYDAIDDERGRVVREYEAGIAVIVDKARSRMRATT